MSWIHGLCIVLVIALVICGVVIKQLLEENKLKAANDEGLNIRLIQKINRAQAALLKARLTCLDECASKVSYRSPCDCGTVEYNRALENALTELQQ